jgi:hypothetical protein
MKETSQLQSIRFMAVFSVLALALSLPAFAKDANSGSFDLTQPVQVGSTVLQPGHYKAEWTGPKTALQISILRDGKTVVTTQGTLKELSSKAPYDAVTVRNLDDHTTRVDEIDFNHRTEALVLAGS